MWKKSKRGIRSVDRGTGSSHARGTGSSLSKHTGFTLVELLVVLGILAVLISIAVPVTMGVITNSNNTADVAQANMMTDSLETWAVDFMNYEVAVKQADGRSDVVVSGVQDKLVRVYNLLREDRGVVLGGLDDYVGVQEFKRTYLTDAYFPDDIDLLQAVLGVYMQGGLQGFETKTADSCYWYSAKAGRIVFEKLSASQGELNAKLTDLMEDVEWVRLEKE